jgi:putative membrane protein
MEKRKIQRSSTRSFSDYFVLSLKGVCMGASDVVPGVSGGTMAFILGIYEELIEAIKSFDLKSLQLLLACQFRRLLDHISWKFLLAVGIGILTAIFTLAHILSWLLQNRPVFIWSFFFGLILASVVTVSRRVQTWQLSTWLCLAGGTIGSYFLVGLVPVSTPNAPWFLILCGAVAICAMILPGISGSFILLLLGKYQYVLEAVNQKDFLVLGLVAVGACGGIIAFSRLLGWLLKRYHDLMVAVLTGLMLGSLRKVWPWKETLESAADIHGRLVPLVQANILPRGGEFAIPLLLMGVGLAVVLFLERLGAKQTGSPRDD